MLLLVALQVRADGSDVVAHGARLQRVTMMIAGGEGRCVTHIWKHGAIDALQDEGVGATRVIGPAA